MIDQDQQKWLKGFSRIGFLLPGIYLLRARQYLFAIIIYVVPAIINYLMNDILLSLIIYLIVGITIGIKGRRLAFAKTKKSFEDFKNEYRKASKVIIIVFLILFGIIFVGIFVSALIPRLAGAQSKARNTARKADLNQIMIGLNAYQTDNNKFPSDLAELANSYLTNIPKDPSGVKGCDQASEGSYYYKAIEKDGVQDGGYILQAFMEKEGTNASANFFSDGCFAEGGQLEDCKGGSCKGKENPKYVITQ